MEKSEKKFGYVYTCFDPKIHKELERIFDERFGAEKYFFDSDPGAEKNLATPEVSADVDFVIRKMKKAHALHPFEFIIIVGHSDCGAYKLAGITFVDAKREGDYHAYELKKAAAVVKTAFPQIAVETHYFLKDEKRMAW